MTATIAQRQRARAILAPIAADSSDIVRRRYRALVKECPASVVLSTADQMGLSVLKVGDHMLFFKPARLVWIKRPQTIEEM